MKTYAFSCFCFRCILIKYLLLNDSLLFEWIKQSLEKYLLANRNIKMLDNRSFFATGYIKFKH